MNPKLNYVYKFKLSSFKLSDGLLSTPKWLHKFNEILFHLIFVCVRLVSVKHWSHLRHFSERLCDSDRPINCIIVVLSNLFDKIIEEWSIRRTFFIIRCHPYAIECRTPFSQRMCVCKCMQYAVCTTICNNPYGHRKYLTNQTTDWWLFILHIYLTLLKWALFCAVVKIRHYLYQRCIKHISTIYEWNQLNEILNGILNFY